MLSYEEWCATAPRGSGYSDYVIYYQRQQELKRVRNYYEGQEWASDRVTATGYGMYNLLRGDCKTSNKQINNKLLLLL